MSVDCFILFERNWPELRIYIREQRQLPPQKARKMARKDTYTVEQWTDLAKDARYDPECLARLLRVGPRQLRRYTHELFNNSPQEWLDEQRLANAAILLQSNELIKTIAFDLGFKTVSHFSHKFKAHYGVSPNSYKKELERFKRMPAIAIETRTGSRQHPVNLSQEPIRFPG